jgi:hypothetical protein
MIEGMSISACSRRVDDVLSARDGNAPKADMLLDQYTMLRSNDDREAFVAALIHKLLVLEARHRGRSATRA